jgi:hypothetical protein
VCCHLSKRKVLRPELFQPVNDLLRGFAVDADSLLAELLPAHPQCAVLLPVSHLPQALGIGGRAASSDGGKSLPPPDPSPQFVHIVPVIFDQCVAHQLSWKWA